MKKVINPCKSKAYNYRGEEFLANAYVKIEYTNGRLSISGVVGPYSNGDCAGSCGQCVDSIREGVPQDGWTQEMIEKLCNIWDEWHLNDMRAYCQHQKELGWREQAREEITLYHYRLADFAYKAKENAKGEAIKYLKEGRTFVPTKEQSFFANLEYGLDVYGELSEELIPYYNPKTSLYVGDKGFTEIKTRGWVTYKKESDKGLLCKPCPVCGYKYGTSWLKEDVPQEIIDWLFALPTTKTQPAWSFYR